VSALGQGEVVRLLQWFAREKAPSPSRVAHHVEKHIGFTGPPPALDLGVAQVWWSCGTPLDHTTASRSARG